MSIVVQVGAISNNLVFKKELSDIEIIGIKAIVDSDDYTHDLHTSSEDLGLTYTSSSSYAALWATEDRKFWGNKIVAFTLTENNRLIMVCADADENYTYFSVILN